MATAPAVNPSHKVVSHAEWIAARKDFLAKEKDFTHLRDEISRQRQELPWEKVEKNYVFEGPNGKVSLAELFGTKSQLIVYHFMFGPEWKEGCPSCSYLGDHFDGASRTSRTRRCVRRDFAGPSRQDRSLQETHGLEFQLGFVRSAAISTSTTTFPSRRNKREAARSNYNYEMPSFQTKKLPGASCFYKDEAGNIYHTYSSYGRGLDQMISAYNWLDIAPKGRDEANIKPPMSWVRHHDKYPESVLAGKDSTSACCHHENP